MKGPNKYNAGDKIFAKVKGFVYWPARVNPLPSDIVIPPNKIPIFFYGTHEVFFITQTSCWPYDEKNKLKWGKPKSRAHFNQGMDEIENYSTIYQYGVDPAAEEFLSQFYEFRKVNGQHTTPNKLQKKVVSEDSEDSTKVKEDNNTKKSATKKRNTSGSSMSTKENKNSSKLTDTTEVNVFDIKLESIVELNNLTDQSSSTARKRHRSEASAVSTKEMENDEALEDVDKTAEQEHHTTTRKRQKSGASAMSTNEKENGVTGDEMENNVNTPEDRITTRKRHKSGASAKAETKKAKSTKPRTLSKKRMSANVKEEKIKMELSMGEEENSTDIINTVVLKTEFEMKTEIGSNGDEPHYEVYTEKTGDDTEAQKADEYKIIQEIDQEIDGINCRPTTRCRIKSSSTKPSNNKSLTEKKSDIDTESPSVDSDNLEDEDFRPAIKSKRMSKKLKTPKQVKVQVKKTPTMTLTKKTPKLKQSVPKKSKIKVESDDSLSSISSDEEDWKAKDEKQKKKNEEKMRDLEMQKLQMEEMAVKEASKKLREKRISDSVNLAKVEKEENEDVKQEKIPEEVECKLDKEIIVNLFKSDIAEEENTKTESVCIDIAEMVNSVKSCEMIAPEELEFKNQVCDSKPEAEMVIEKTPTPTKKSKGRKNVAMIESEKEENENVIYETPIAMPEKSKKISTYSKEGKVSKSAKKVKPVSRKRNRRISSSSSNGSDIEITKSEEATKSPTAKRLKQGEKSSDSDENKSNEVKIVEKASVDKLEILQNFNVDIRSSLVLGQEDYNICLMRFKSLCEMDIDLVSLVKVWQLMDTVKKCRRYKRNEQVKQQAQAVYKRFMEIYSQASKDEVNASQALLGHYRHQNNLQNQNVSNGTDTSGVSTNSKTNAGLTIPISVADMFQNKLSCQFESNSSKAAQANTESRKFHIPNGAAGIKQPEIAKLADRHLPTEEEINEEKMRLLSADLEAKVSDILNKIEKNVDTNPINQKSLSHLLPSKSDVATIKLPTHWRSVGSHNKISERERLSMRGEMSDEDDDDDEEDDVEAIVRRIEEVAIKLPEELVELPTDPVLDVSVTSNNIMGGGGMMSMMSGMIGMGSSSALDARIENLINNSFISTAVPKETRQHQSQSQSQQQQQQQRKSRTSSSRHHRSSKVPSPPAPLATRTSSHHQQQQQHSKQVDQTPKLQQETKQHHHQQQPAPKVELQPTNHPATPTIINTPNTINNSHQEQPFPIITSIIPSSLLSSLPKPDELLDQDLQKDDIEIYDLLGV